MDPQKLSQLDPKLRDAYQRVMGTAIPQSQPAPIPEPQSEPQQEPISAPNVQPPATPEPFFIPQPVANPEPQVPVQQPPPTQNFTAPPPMPAQTAAIKKKSGITPVLFGIVGLIFLVIYTLFWTKIFNLKLPFLP